MNAATWIEGIPAPGKWREILVSHGPRIATWTLVLALSVQAAVIVTDLAGSSQEPDVPAAPAGAIAPPANRSVNVAAITNAHLFGNAEPEPVAATGADAPQTSAPLVLTGIIAADNPKNGFAIVGESATSAKVYAVGDNLPGGVRLHEVLGDRILIERNGQIESLALPRQMLATAGPAAPLATAPLIGSGGGGEVVDRMRRVIADEPGLISDIMRPQPVFAQGKQRGYRVYPGRNRQAFGRLGLRPGDLVVAINGTPLDDPARGQEVFRTIGSSSEAHVTVMRNGRQQDLTLNMAQMAQEAEQLVGTEGITPVDQSQPVPQPSEPEGGEQ